MKTGSLAPHLGDLGSTSPAVGPPVEREFDLVRRISAPGPGEYWFARWGDPQQTAIVRIVQREAVSEDRAAFLERDLARLAKLPPHPNLATLLAAYPTGNRFVFAAAQVDGEDLLTLVRQTGPMPTNAVIECLSQALKGLKHAHDHGVAHGNLTPSDLILDFNGVLKICNYGWAGLTPSGDFESAVANDLHALAQVLTWLAYGNNAPNLASLRNGEQSAAPAAEGADRQMSAAPSELVGVYTGLLSAGTPGGFGSAEEALASLDTANTLVDGRMVEPGSRLPSCPNSVDFSDRDLRFEILPSPSPDSCRSTTSFDIGRHGHAAEPTKQPETLPLASHGNQKMVWVCGALALATMLAALAGFLMWT